MKNRVVITGIGVISSLGNSCSELFSSLCNGRNGIRLIAQLSTNGHKCGLASQLLDFRGERYLTGRPLRPLDRASQLAAAACGLALEQSGLDADWRQQYEVSLVLGTMFGGMHTIGDFDRTAMTSGPSTVSPMSFANTVINAAAGQCAIWHDLRGMNSTVAAGSVSGIRAIGHASDLIQLNRATTVVAGGMDEFSLESYFGFANAGLLCTNCSCPECPIPFERCRNGFALGEGAGFLVLEEYGHAIARGAKPLAEILGHATAFDKSQGRDPDRAIRTVVRAMGSAVERSGLCLDKVGFISASANGSVVRDCYELGALAALFRDRVKHLPVTAVKGSLGEPLGAAGPLQVASAIEVFKQEKLPGIPGLHELPAGYSLEGICAETREMSANYALVNGIGLDGNCCSLVVGRYES